MLWSESGSIGHLLLILTRGGRGGQRGDEGGPHWQQGRGRRREEGMAITDAGKKA